MNTETKIGRPAESETDRLFRELDKPSLENLAYALRHPETWPKEFHWNFNYCEHCAMGLAHQLWAKNVAEARRSTGASIMAQAFAIPFSASREIFFGAGFSYRYRNGFPVLFASAITPEMVADKIDRFLKAAVD